MNEQLLIRLDPVVKRKLSQAATRDGKTTTQVVRDLIEEYLRQRDMPAYIADLWDRIGTELVRGGVTRKDVARAIKAARTANAARAGRR